MIKRMCEYKSKAYLTTPKWMKRKRRATIEVDSCCAELLSFLWEKGIDTLYHCCGHSYRKPYLILAKKYNISEIRKLIRQKDKRKWIISY